MEVSVKREFTVRRTLFYFHWSGKNIVIICSRALYGLKAGFHFKL